MVIVMSKGVLATVSAFSVGILVVVAGFFLLDIEKIAINMWAFGSLLFSLAVSLLTTVTLVAPKRDKDGVFYTAGLSSAIWIYQTLVIISILFTKSFDSLNGFIFLQILINALFAIVTVIVIMASARIHENNVKTYEKLQNGEYDKPKRGGF